MVLTLSSEGLSLLSSLVSLLDSLLLSLEPLESLEEELPELFEDELSLESLLLASASRLRHSSSDEPSYWVLCKSIVR